MAIPLHIRVPLEYGFSMVFALAIAWLYATFARADFVLSLGVGLSMVVGFWVFAYAFWKKLRKAMVHPITIALLGITAAFALGVIGL